MREFILLFSVYMFGEIWQMSWAMSLFEFFRLIDFCHKRFLLSRIFYFYFIHISCYIKSKLKSKKFMQSILLCGFGLNKQHVDLIFRKGDNWKLMCRKWNEMQAWMRECILPKDKRWGSWIWSIIMLKFGRKWDTYILL